MTTYFLSYARSDEITALRLADALIAGGVSVWVDQYDIRPSQHWDHAVESAVRACQGMIVILSPRSVASPNVADEVSVAIEEGKDILPVLIESCTLPLRMTRMQYIDAIKDFDAAVNRCLGTIANKAEPRPALQSAPQPPAPRLAAAALEAAERRLTGFIGPIASVLVRQAAGQVSTENDLYDALARSIANPTEREHFLDGIARTAGPGSSAPPAENALSLDDVQALTAALTRRLGPIAAQLVSRESARASSRQELRQNLAARIQATKDRVAFLRETESL